MTGHWTFADGTTANYLYVGSRSDIYRIIIEEKIYILLKLNGVVVLSIMVDGMDYSVGQIPPQII